jgi:pimeloyl-ACP methyl ester carboxylesterase
LIAPTEDIDIAYFEVGRGDPLILVHGLGDDHRAWRHVVGPLMLGRQVILYDLRGHGRTTLGAADGTLDQLAGDLLSLLDHLAIERATVAGFSLGGTIAMRAAIDHPERIVAIALVATSSRVNGAARAWYLERAAMAQGGATPELRAVLDRDTEDVYAQEPEHSPTGLKIRRESTADPAGYANACRAMARLGEQSLDDELVQIAIPTTILAGEADQHCPPRAGRIIAERIAGSTLSVLPGAGHPIPVERPAAVVRAIQDLEEA